jgi:hypothetical protein
MISSELRSGPDNNATVLDPLFTIRDLTGVRRVGLHEVLTACQNGTLLDLPKIATHQRAPLTELLAIIIAASRLYASANTPAPVTSEDWLAALAGASPSIPLEVIPDPGKAGFLQPAMSEYNACSEGDVDTLGAAARHSVKSRQTFDVEDAIYSLIGGLHRGYGGRGHCAAARQRSLTVMIGDGSVASEVMTLADALPTRPGTCLADHLLWSRSWMNGEPLASLPQPIVDCRPVQLVHTNDDTVTFAWATTSASRVSDEWLDDPHVPRDVATGASWRLSDGRGWSHRVLHATLFGSPQVRRPPILDRDGAWSVRIASLHTVQKGLMIAAHHEAVMTVDGGLWDAQRCADLSQRALTSVSAAERAVWVAATMLHREGGGTRRTPTVHSDAARTRVTALVGMSSVQVVLQLLPRQPDLITEQQAIERMALDAVVIAWHEQVRAHPDIIAASQATLLLDRQVRAHLPTTGGFPMILVNDPRTHALLHEMQGRYTPAQRASVRSTAADVLPYAAVVMLAFLPKADADDRNVRVIWLSAIRALAALRHGGSSVGSVLADTRYPLTRLQALLAATGDALVSLMDEVWRWMVARDVRSVTMTDLVSLGLADAAHSAGAVDDLRLRIALDYARASERQQHAA